MFASYVVGYLFGYAPLTNTRSLALVGDPNANAYKLLLAFSSSRQEVDVFVWLGKLQCQLR
jgi:hypothetical protein